MESLRMYFKLLTISFEGRMQFRADFFVGMISVIVLNIFSLATIGVVLNRFQSLAGWSMWEIVFLYSLWILGHSVFSLLFWHLDELEYFITQGTFDMFLIRPISPFLQLLGREINYTGFADVVVGVSGLAISLTQLHLTLSPLQWLYLIVIVFSGTLIEFSLTLSLATIAFWTGRSQASIDSVMQVSFLIQRYPVDMFGRAFRLFVTGIVPVAFMNYFPARLLLGKIPPGDPWAFLSYLSPVVALLLLGLASVVWRIGIRNYSSSGG